MSYDLNVLTEMYSILKEYIPSKDKQEAVDSLLCSLADCLSDEDFEEFAQTDKYTKNSLTSHLGLDDSDEFEDDY